VTTPICVQLSEVMVASLKLAVRMSFANLKSGTLTRPSLVIITLAGFETELLHCGFVH
jgi:hypothetical protein